MMGLAVSLSGIGHTLGTIAAMLVGFGVLIFAHELGHFIVAKLVGIRVEAFALGFGPKIFGRKRGDTEYKLNWIPFGGYVKLAGMEAEEGKAPQEIEGGFYSVARWKRALAVLAGPVFNFLLALIIFLVLYYTGIYKTEYEYTTVIGAIEEPSENFRPDVGELRVGDKLLFINEREIGKWQDVIEAVALADTDEFTIKVLRDGEELTVHAKSAKDMEQGLFRLGISPKESVLVQSVKKDEPAAEMGLERGDEIVGVNDKEIFNLYDFKTALKEHVGETITVGVLRGDEELSLDVTVPEPREESEYPILGFEVSVYGPLVKITQTPGESFRNVFDMTYKTLKRLFARSRVKVSPRAMTGPFGIMRIIGANVWLSFSSYAWFIAFLSVNLGIINLLPIPVIDGGHLLFTGIEAIARRPINERVMAVITNVFVVAIISFFIYISYFDIKKYYWPTIRGWFVSPKEEVETPKGDEGEKATPEGEEENGEEEKGSSEGAAAGFLNPPEASVMRGRFGGPGIASVQAADS